MVFVGALLLFGLEPLVGRSLTPQFGGAVYVWLTCLMFFQAMLLIGYFYAHALAPKLGRWHLLLLALPFVNLPLSIHAEPSTQAPLVPLLVALLVNVALPFVVLSTTAVVAQSWLTGSFLAEDYEPYPLYAASNAGSLVALLGYAFLAEPLLGLRVQSLAWTGIYMIYALLVIAAWFLLHPEQRGKKSASKELSATARESAPSLSQYLWWLLLSGLPSAFLMAFTNFIALEVGSFPMVWIVPLALYLASFIVTFRRKGGVPRFLNVVWLEVLLLGFNLYLLTRQSPILIIAHLLVFFGVCLLAHGTLYEHRPSAKYLTNFYLATAIGGWLGGAVVILLVPHIFKGLFEYPILLLALSITFCFFRRGSFTPFWPKTSFLLKGVRTLILGGLLGFIAVGIWFSLSQPSKFRHRNFYGTYQILDELTDKSVPGGIRKLVHGRTLHGAQLLDPKVRMTPVAYYFHGGGISDVFDSVLSPRQIAVVGLGSGTVSAYGKPGDSITFYEIDPDNEQIARSWFTYLNESEGRVKVVAGDGRLSLKMPENDGERYDIVLIDAFTGDGIPTHLLTREAVVLYLSRLAENGIVLFHISNRFYDLRPVIKSVASELRLFGAMNVPLPKRKLKSYQRANQCVAVARSSERLQPLLKKGWIPFGEGDGLERTAPWTDDHINILAPLLSRFKTEYNF